MEKGALFRFLGSKVHSVAIKRLVDAVVRRDHRREAMLVGWAGFDGEDDANGGLHFVWKICKRKKNTVFEKKTKNEPLAVGNLMFVWMLFRRCPEQKKIHHQYKCHLL